MRTTTILTIALHLLIAICNAQPKEKWVLTDTVDLSFAPVNFTGFQAFQEHSPLVSFKNGVYMPYENLWFYKIEDPAVALSSFSLSHADTSLYLVVSGNGNDRIIRMKKTVDDSQKENIIEISTSGKHTLYPITDGFYLLTQSSEATSLIEFFDGTSMKLIMKSKKAIRKLLPIDNRSFIATFENDVVLFNAGSKPVNLFYSEVSINDISATDEGRFIISTLQGVYSLDKGLSSSNMICTAHDGQLATFDASLFVLSNADRKIYRYVKR